MMLHESGNKVTLVCDGACNAWAMASQETYNDVFSEGGWTVKGQKHYCKNCSEKRLDEFKEKFNAMKMLTPNVEIPFDYCSRKEFYTKLLAKLESIHKGDLSFDDYMEEVRAKVAARQDFPPF